MYIYIHTYTHNIYIHVYKGRTPKAVRNSLAHKPLAGTLTIPGGGGILLRGLPDCRKYI